MDKDIRQLDDDDYDSRNPKKIKMDESKLIEVPTRSNVVKSHLYENKLILAPMVRANSLAFRLLCLRYGADLVYSEELIDHRVVTCKRFENKAEGTIDFIDKDGRVIFKTCQEERNRIVFQLGSNNPERALKAAKLVSQDVMGIDFNFGCPKKFSIAGGMGAALLEEPDKIQALLTTCVTNLDIPVTCKIRLLPNLDDTLKLVKLIQSCGVSAIAVHGRTKDQRPSHDNDINSLKAIGETLTIPLIANGESNNIKSYQDVMRFRSQTKASSVMIARSAMKNPSIFIHTQSSTKEPLVDDCNYILKNTDSAPPNDDFSNVDPPSKPNVLVQSQTPSSVSVVDEYVKLAVRYNIHPSNIKYSLQSLMSNSENRRSKEFSSNLHRANTIEKICELFKLPHPSKTTATQASNETN